MLGYDLMNYKDFGKCCSVYKSFFLDDKESLRTVLLCLQAKIHPEQPAILLSTDDCKHLRAAIHEVHAVFTLDSFFFLCCSLWVLHYWCFKVYRCWRKQSKWMQTVSAFLRTGFSISAGTGSLASWTVSFY